MSVPLFVREAGRIRVFFGLLVCFPCCQSIVTLRKLLSLVNGTSVRVDTDWQPKHCKESQNLCARANKHSIVGDQRLIQEGVLLHSLTWQFQNTSNNITQYGDCVLVCGVSVVAITVHAAGLYCWWI